MSETEAKWVMKKYPQTPLSTTLKGHLEQQVQNPTTTTMLAYRTPILWHVRELQTSEM